MQTASAIKIVLWKDTPMPLHFPYSFLQRYQLTISPKLQHYVKWYIILLDLHGIYVPIPDTSGNCHG